MSFPNRNGGQIMSKNRVDNFHVQGDGNAIGDHNRVTIIKHDNRQTHYGGGGRSSGKDDGAVGAFIGLIVIASIAIAASGYYFAKHADLIYTVFKITSGIGFALATSIAASFYNRRYEHEMWKCIVAGVLMLGTLVSVFQAYGQYPPDMLELAQQSKGYAQFWCRLSLYGQQVAFLHVVTALLYTSGLLLLSLPMLVYGVLSVFDVEVTELTYAIVEKTSSWWTIMLGSLLLATAIFGHTNKGWEVWSDFHDKPQARFICPNGK
jgi:hypothetical protein